MRPCLLSLSAISLTVSVVAFLSPATAGDLYKWTDEKGQVHYSSTPPPDTAKKAKTLDTKALSKINALPSDPNADRASVDSPTDDSNASTPATPAKTASGNTQETAPASPPALIPASLLPPSNPPATAKPEQPAQSDTVEVVAQGMGADANAALLNAYSNAVQQALGSYVDAETLVQNDQIVRDKILTYSKGFIEKADIVSQNQANGLFQVNIRAKVKRQQLLEQAKANNISVKAVEGVSFHAKVMSQIKQEQDANTLLEKALLPFAGADLMRAELVGEPRILGQEQGNITLSYPVHFFIDENNYKKSTSDLIAILDSISSDKKEFTMKNKNLENHEYFFKFMEDTDLLRKSASVNAKNCTSLVTWNDKGFTHSKWITYSLLNDFDLKKLAEKLNRPEIEIELSLLGKDQEIIAMGNISIEDHYIDKSLLSSRIKKTPDTGVLMPFSAKDFSPIRFDRDLGLGYCSYIIRSYFSYGNIGYSEMLFDIEIKVSQQDLLKVKS